MLKFSHRTAWEGDDCDVIVGNISLPRSLPFRSENSPKFRKLGILSVFKIAINNKVVSMCKSLLKFSEGLLNKLNSKVAKKKYPITLIKNIRVW